jgi:hypothetical protein
MKTPTLQELIAAVILARARYKASSDKPFTVEDFARYLRDTDEYLFANCVVRATGEFVSGDLPISAEDVHEEEEIAIAHVVSWITRRLPAED